MAKKQTIGKPIQPLSDVVPELVQRVVEAAHAINRSDIAEQIRAVQLRDFSYDASVDAGYLYVNESRPLNFFEQHVIGVRHDESIPLDLPGIVVIDLDNFGRVLGIELIGYADLFRELGRDE